VFPITVFIVKNCIHLVFFNYPECGLSGWKTFFDKKESRSCYFRLTFDMHMVETAAIFIVLNRDMEEIVFYE